MLKGEKIALLAFVLYAGSGYIFEAFEGVTINYLRFNTQVDNMAYWLTLRAAATLALVSAYYYTRDKYELMSYIVLTYGITHFLQELVYQTLFFGDSYNDTLLIVTVVVIVGYMAWKKGRKERKN